jgi:hypothetical protein
VLLDSAQADAAERDLDSDEITVGGHSVVIILSEERER